MELSFDNIRTVRFTARRQQRLARAGWWFERMREVVDQAVSWEPLPTPPAEQTLFPHAYRRPLQAGEPRRSAEQQIAA